MRVAFHHSTQLPPLVVFSSQQVNNKIIKFRKLIDFSQVNYILRWKIGKFFFLNRFFSFFFCNNEEDKFRNCLCWIVDILWGFLSFSTLLIDLSFCSGFKGHINSPDKKMKLSGCLKISNDGVPLRKLQLNLRNVRQIFIMPDEQLAKMMARCVINN